MHTEHAESENQAQTTSYDPWNKRQKLEEQTVIQTVLIFDL
jgi:hypothetical protein